MGTSMTSVADPSSTRRKSLIGPGLSVLVALLLLFDTSVKFLTLPVAVQGMVQLWYPAAAVFWIGLLELASLVLYLLPRTSVLGALLLTGYLGGAIAMHVRAGSPVPTHVLFPLYIALLMWAGLYLRERRLGVLQPSRSGA